MIYNTIEEEIVPKYYRRDEENIPNDWIESVKICVADIAANFTTNRMLTDYEERFYHKLYDRKPTTRRRRARSRPGNGGSAAGGTRCM